MKLPSLEELESAAQRIYAVFPATPQVTWPLLNERCGCEVWVKHENQTPVGAFKIRGGLVFLDKLKHRQPKLKGVIAATRGNHGQSVAFAANRCGLNAVILVPKGNSASKNAAMRAMGAELIVRGDDFQEALEQAAVLAEADGLAMIPSYHYDLVKGVGTYSLELFRRIPNLDTLYVPIGLGSGVCGAIAARAALNLKTEIVGVVSEAAPAYAVSFQARRSISKTVGPTIADGMACRVPNDEALEAILNGVSRIVTVDDDQVKAAMRDLFDCTHNVAEGAGAAALAALRKERDQMQGRRVAIVLTGGNIVRNVYSEVLSGEEVSNPRFAPAL